MITLTLFIYACHAAAAQRSALKTTNGDTTTSVARGVRSDPAQREGKEKVVLRPALRTREAKPELRTGRAANAPREEAVIDFVRRHQPKLLGLLEYLKKNQPPRYQQALAELFRSRQRLDHLEQQDPELYAIEFELWRVQSQQRLVAAEISAAQPGKRNDADLEQLKALVERQLEKELERIRLQRVRHAKLLEQLDEEIERRTSSSPEILAEQLAIWQNRVASVNARKARVQGRRPVDSK